MGKFDPFETIMETAFEQVDHVQSLPSTTIIEILNPSWPSLNVGLSDSSCSADSLSATE